MEWRTAFIGRDEEIAAVRDLLAGTRLLTLTGPGGIGKTRLAVEAIGPSDAQGVRSVFVELASVRDPDQLLAAVAAGIDLRESSAVDLLHVVSERLARTETLLILDNFEQIVSAGPTVGSLLDATPSLRVVVTSRVPLHLTGEQEYPVPPLATPREGTALSVEGLGAVESVRLFAERARSVRPDFELTIENAPAVADICRRLDGLPLALELAASRLKVLAPEAILGRLGQRLGLLTGGAADAPARQRTLRATIAWSYELLPESERDVLARCAVFTGGFGLDAAHAVTQQAESGLLEALVLLVDHNLMTASGGSDGEPRFAMLETIREFALGELSTADAAAARDRHADFYVDLVESAEGRLQGPEHARWLGRLNEDLDNIRAARAWLSERGAGERLCRLVAAIGTYWRYYGSINEGLIWLREALERSGDISPATRAGVLMNAGWLAAVSGDLQRGRDLLGQAAALYEELGEGIRVARTLYHLGSTLIDLREPAAARAVLKRALTIAVEQGDSGLQGRVLWDLARVSSNVPELAQLLEDSIVAATRAGDLQRVALSLTDAGWVAWRAGDRDAAVASWNEAVVLLRNWGERAFLGSVLMARSFGERMTGRIEDSRHSLIEGLRLTREAGAVPDVAACLADVAKWLQLAGADARARATWAAAEQLAAGHGVPLEHTWQEQEVVAVPMPALRAFGTTPAKKRALTAEEALNAAERDLETTPVHEVAGERSARSPFELTAREREVLELVVAGRSNAEIGEALFISRKTASVHVANIKEKLGADSRVGIVTIALDRGLVRRDG